MSGRGHEDHAHDRCGQSAKKQREECEPTIIGISKQPSMSLGLS